MLSIKKLHSNKCLFDYATSTFLFKHLKPSKDFFFYNSLARLNGLYDIIICLVRLTQMFVTAHHNIKMFFKIAPFLQYQFIKKLICDLISQLIFKLFFNKLKVISRRFGKCTICTINISFYTEKVNFKTCGVTFYPFQKGDSVKTGDFNPKTL